MKVLVLGVTGMLGNTLFRCFYNESQFELWGTLRNSSGLRYFSGDMHNQLITNVDVNDYDSLVTVIARIKPDVVINCVGLIKQHNDINDPLFVLPVNALLPHRLNKLCMLTGCRLIHFSTDCVFVGDKGMYVESDISDAKNLYGKSKYLGEIHDSPFSITIRTSIIGHELATDNSLVDWFLSQTGTVKGYTRAIFSGLPVVELAKIITQYVIPNTELSGLYHVSAEPIDKMSLLQLVAKEYGKSIVITPDDELRINRSLDSAKFRESTGYTPPAWPELVRLMHETYIK